MGSLKRFIQEVRHVDGLSTIGMLIGNAEDS